MFSGTLEVGSVVRKDSGRRATSGDELYEGSQEIFCGQVKTQVEMHTFGEKAYEYHDVTLDQGGFPGVSSPAGEAKSIPTLRNGGAGAVLLAGRRPIL